MGHTSGNVKCKGEVFQSLWQLTNNYYCRPNGVRFLATAGSAEFARRNKVNVGDIVSFKHRGFLLATKKPKFPSLYRVRSDLEWDDVVNNWKEMKTIRSYGMVLPSSLLLMKSSLLTTLCPTKWLLLSRGQRNK